MNKLLSSTRTFAIEEDGAQILEYALIVAVVSITLIGLFGTIDFTAWVDRVNELLVPAAAPPAA